MKAIQIDAHGGPEVLVLRDLPEPTAGPGQVVIRVESAAVNWSDTMRRRNDPYPFPTPLPFIPGGEVAGTVEALGDGVDGPAVGTPVFALVGGDGSTGYAQYAVADAQMVIPRPEHVGADEAAAILVAGGTAIVMLRKVAGLQPAETVLIGGGGGGVGSYAVQLARVMGAGTIVAAAGSPARRDLALALGADEVVDYGTPGWHQELRESTVSGIDVALEGVGGAVTAETFATLAPFGRMVVYGYASGTFGSLGEAEQEALFYRPVLNQVVTGLNIGLWFGLRPHSAAAALGELIGHVASGAVKVQIGAVLPLADAAEGHHLLEERNVTGKIVLKPW
jgi:NADPH:quinone reductase-like Zn-dependent oxidoreductase